MLQPLPRSSGSSTTSSRGTQSLTGVRGEKASTASHLLRSGLKPFRGIRVSMRKKKSSKQSRRSLSRAGSGRSSHLKSSSGGIRLSQDDMHELRAMAAAASTASASSSPYTMGTATDMGSGTTAKLQSWRSGWKALGRTSKRKNTTPPLYSISFYPWKMEAHGYYSHPEAAAEWVPDTASSRCQICLTSFSLTRRRHHCRLCGRLVCGECSLQRTYLPLAKDRRQHHQMIKDGAPQRTCNSCANTLKNMVAQHDHRVKCFAVDHGVPVDTATSMPTRSASMSTLRDSTLSEDPYETALSLPGDDSTRSVVTSDDIPTRAEELEVILRARAFSRDRSVSAQYVISSQWLEQWLQYVHMDPSAPPAMAFTGSGMSSQSSTSSSRWHTTRRKARNRRPGPIANYALVDFVNGKLVPKSELERSRGNDVGGDYRVVSEDVWFAFHELYGGGPSIRLQQPSPGRRSFSGGSLSSRALISTSSFYSTASTRSLDMVEFVDTARWVISECDEHIRVATSAARIAIGDGVGSSGEYARQTTSVSSLHRRRDGSKTMPPRRPYLASEDSFLPEPTRGRQKAASHATASSSSMKSSTRTRQTEHWRPHRRSSDDLTSSSSTVTRVTVGTVLYDPNDLETASVDSASSNMTTSTAAAASKPQDPRQTIAAVSAFATAAAQARKKSAMSLSRHSAVITGRSTHSSVASA